MIHCKIEALESKLRQNTGSAQNKDGLLVKPSLGQFFHFDKKSYANLFDKDVKFWESELLK